VPLCAAMAAQHSQPARLARVSWKRRKTAGVAAAVAAGLGRNAAGKARRSASEVHGSSALPGTALMVAGATTTRYQRATRNAVRHQAAWGRDQPMAQ
jgi:hypothetical protein